MRFFNIMRVVTVTLMGLLTVQAQAEPLPLAIPTLDELCADITLTLENSPARVYAYTDRVGGFWEGRTFGYNGYCGYKIDGQCLLTDFVVHIDDRLLDRRKAEFVAIRPHQIQHEWESGVTETITVIAGQTGMIVELNSPSPVNWSLTPLFPMAEEQIATTAGSSDRKMVFQDQQTGVSLIVNPEPSGSWSVSSLDVTAGIDSDKTGLGTLSVKPTMKLIVIFLFGRDTATIDRHSDEVVANAHTLIAARQIMIGQMLLDSYFQTNLPEYDKALHWAKITGDDLVVTQFGTGIWAGLPWFHQSWGRDTFIALPGISLVTGQFDDAAAIIKSFSEFQIDDPANERHGRVPNRVVSPTDIIYNTTDGTPWLIREIAEYVQYTGDKDFAAELYPVIKLAIAGALQNFVDDLGFLTHDDADTWMDARIRGAEAWSPRGNRAVDIQTLWYTQLRASAVLAQLLGHEADAGEWNNLADKLKINFNLYFHNTTQNALYDHLNFDGSVDVQIRPNQMFALTIPLDDELVPLPIQSGVVCQVVRELLYPYGVASLSQNDPYFHPYHHDQIYHYDAAYHNGMCWQWNAGTVVGGMVKLGYENLAFEFTQNLADQILNLGMPGSMSELVEPAPLEDGSLTLTGTYSQAWSVSEFVRHFYQDYAGIRPNMPHREVHIAPRLPDKLTVFNGHIKIGQNEAIECHLEKERFGFLGKDLKKAVTVRLSLMSTSRAEFEFSFELAPGAYRAVELTDRDHMAITLDGKSNRMTPTGVELPAIDHDLTFQKFHLNPNLKTIQEPNFLENIRLHFKRTVSRVE